MENLINLINLNLDLKSKIVNEIDASKKKEMSDEIEINERKFTELFSHVSMYKYSSATGKYYSLKNKIPYDTSWKNFVIEVVKSIYKRNQKMRLEQLHTITREYLVAHESAAGIIEFDEFDLIDTIEVLRKNLDGDFSSPESVDLKGFKVKGTTTVIQLHYKEDSESIFFFLQDESITHLRKSISFFSGSDMEINNRKIDLSLNPSSLILYFDSYSSKLYCHNTFSSMKILSLRDSIRNNTFKVLNEKINLNENVKLTDMTTQICKDVLSNNMFDHMNTDNYVEICKAVGISTTRDDTTGLENYYIGKKDLQKFIDAVLAVSIKSKHFGVETEAKSSYKGATTIV